MITPIIIGTARHVIHVMDQAGEVEQSTQLLVGIMNTQSAFVQAAGYKRREAWIVAKPLKRP